jgi:hypothetical protein
MWVKKTITIFALCLAALLPLCLSGFFIAGRIIIRITMLEKIEKDALQVISIPTDQIRWYKKNHELMIGGKMFDVKSIRQQGDTSIITGLFDDDDTALHDAFAGIHEQKNNGHHNALMLYQVCLGIIAEQNYLSNHTFIKDFGSIHVSFIEYEDPVMQAYLPIFSPPPESLGS